MRILVQLLAEIESLADVDEVAPATPIVRGVAWYGIPYRPAVWFDSASAAERQSWSRATKRLELDGHAFRTLERFRNRVTHLVPTATGLAWALEACPTADRAAVAEGLRRVDWGDSLLDVLHESTEERDAESSRSVDGDGGRAAEPSASGPAEPSDDEPSVASGRPHDDRLLANSAEPGRGDNPPKTAAPASGLEGGRGADEDLTRSTCTGTGGAIHVEALGEAASEATTAIPEAGELDRELRPSELTRLLNSTSLGTVLNERRLYRQRSRAGYRIGSGRRVHLLKYVAWLAAERHNRRPGSRSRKPSDGGITQGEVLDLLEAQRYRCNLTGRELTPHTASLDHIVSVARGGRHVVDNAQVLHEDVNRAKGTLTNDEFVALCHEVVKHTLRNDPKRNSAA